MYKSQPSKLLVTVMLSSVITFLLGVDTVSASQTLRLESGEVLTDPTKPADWRKKPVKTQQTRAIQYTLNYILNAQERKLAIVNGKKVKEGDMVAGARVLSIRDNEVELSVGGQKRVLRVNKKTSGFMQAK